jgi:hypothetical protein
VPTFPLSSSIGARQGVPPLPTFESRNVSWSIDVSDHVIRSILHNMRVPKFNSLAEFIRYKRWVSDLHFLPGVERDDMHFRIFNHGARSSSWCIQHLHL